MFYDNDKRAEAALDVIVQAQNYDERHSWACGKFKCRSVPTIDTNIFAACLTIGAAAIVEVRFFTRKFAFELSVNLCKLYKNIDFKLYTNQF